MAATYKIEAIEAKKGNRSISLSCAITEKVSFVIVQLREIAFILVPSRVLARLFTAHLSLALPVEVRVSCIPRGGYTNPTLVCLGGNWFECVHQVKVHKLLSQFIRLYPVPPMTH